MSPFFHEKYSVAKFGDSSLEDLLQAYGEGDDEAFNAFFDRIKDLVYNVLLKKIKNSEAAEDIFQETILRIHKYATSYKPQSGSAYGWVLMIAKNCLVDYYQSEKSYGHDRLDPEVRDMANSSVWEEKVFYNDLLRSLSRDLNQDEIDLLVDKFVVELSYDEIAAKRNSESQNVRQRVSRLLKKIRNILVS